MLTLLRVQNFAIIEALEVELGPGLTVITGETGAGKSILVDALELVLGDRGRPEVVRSGAEQAEVEALFHIEEDAPVRARLEAAGIEIEDELVVRRIVNAQGRTRAFVNGKLASASQLSELAAGLADISSQHEHHSLVHPSAHLDYLDAFAQLAPLREEVATLHARLEALALDLANLEASVKGRAEREDLLRFQVREIDELELREVEDQSLAKDRERLRHAEKLAQAAGGAEDALYARDRSICEEIAHVAHSLSEAAKLDVGLEPLAIQVDAARAQLEDAARELGRYARGVTSDPEKLAALEERHHRLDKLKRKYGGSITSILSHREAAARELDSLDHHEERAAEKRAEHEAALVDATRAARDLSKKRRVAAAKLGAAIAEELQSLGMGGAKILVDVAPIDGRAGEVVVDGARLTSTGIDRVEFLIAPNKGEEARPLRKVASGGELSRAMLAIKRVLAGLGPVGLYVFDEVDSGVGGAVAEVIGRKLREVALHQQVICITHLAQIAVFADSHLRVHKESKGERTRSVVAPLAEAERLEEIARMLGGVRIGEKTRAAAAEMLREAQPQQGRPRETKARPAKHARTR